MAGTGHRRGWGDLPFGLKALVAVAAVLWLCGFTGLASGVSTGDFRLAASSGAVGVIGVLLIVVAARHAGRIETVVDDATGTDT